MPSNEDREMTLEQLASKWRQVFGPDWEAEEKAALEKVSSEFMSQLRGRLGEQTPEEVKSLEEGCDQALDDEMRKSIADKPLQVEQVKETNEMIHRLVRSERDAKLKESREEFARKKCNSPTCKKHGGK